MNFEASAQEKVDPLERERREIERRRREEVERKQRFFNEKWRTMGIDVNALQSQINYKNQKKVKEREEDMQMSLDCFYACFFFQLWFIFLSAFCF